MSNTPMRCRTSSPNTKLINSEGTALEPGLDVFQNAAANADWKAAPGFYLILTNQPGKNTWPITGATFILMHKKQDNPERARQVLDFFAWAYKNGAEMAKSLQLCPDAAECRRDLPGQLEADRRTRRQAGVGRARVLTRSGGKGAMSGPRSVSSRQRAGGVS